VKNFYEFINESSDEEIDEKQIEATYLPLIREMFNKKYGINKDLINIEVQIAFETPFVEIFVELDVDDMSSHESWKHTQKNLKAPTWDQLIEGYKKLSSLMELSKKIREDLKMTSDLYLDETDYEEKKKFNIVFELTLKQLLNVEFIKSIKTVNKYEL
jgi:hypothetical protein